MPHPTTLSIFSPLVEAATELAAEWHEGTYRKSRWRSIPFEPPPEAVLRIPAMAHVTAVALIVQRAGWPDETVAAAFLHDVIEDANRFGHSLPPQALAARIGEEVAALVQAVTEPKRDEEGEPLPWRFRKQTYLDGLTQAPVGAVAISLADKLHNAWTMNESLQAGVDIFTSTPTRRGLTAGPEAQRWFFEGVLDASRAYDDPRLIPMRERLEAEVARFVELALSTKTRSAE